MVSLVDLRAQLEDEEANLEAASALWLEAKAGDRDTTKAEAEIKAHESAISRLERQIHKTNKRRPT